MSTAPYLFIINVLLSLYSKCSYYYNFISQLLYQNFRHFTVIFEGSAISFPIFSFMVFVFPGFILTLKVLVRVISSLMVMVNFSFTFVMVLLDLLVKRVV